MTDKPSTQGSHELRRTISLSGAVALVVGGVVGAGIFVQVQPIAAGSGNAIWLAFVTAIVISIFGVIPIIELAGAIPRAGAGFLFASRMLSPGWGYLTSYWLLLGGGASTAVVALTLAKYLPMTPSDHVSALLVMGIFYVVYQFGLRLAMSLQVLMAIQFVTALLLYGIAGAAHVGVAVEALPHLGLGAFIQSMLLAYATCMGFQVIAEMGEEIHNARRNIPLALIIGGALVAAIYVLVGQVYVSTARIHGTEALMAFEQPLTQSATPFLGKGALWFLGLGAVTAGLTSLNAGAIALPREFFAQARDGLASPLLARVSPRTHTPQHAVTVYFLFVGLLIALWRDTDFYGLAAAIGILGVSSVLCFAALRLPSRFPERHAHAFIRFPRWVLLLCTVVTVGVSLVLGAALAMERPLVVGVYVLWTLLALTIYHVQARRFTPKDRARFDQIPGVDE